MRRLAEGSLIHPIFADQFIAGLDRLPSSDPLNDVALATTVAFVVRGETGALESSTVIGSSGVAAFDAAALDTLKRVFPLAPATASMWSSDGRVYLTWKFHRGPEACGTWNAKSFKLAFEQ